MIVVVRIGGYDLINFEREKKMISKCIKGMTDVENKIFEKLFLN